MFYLREIPMLQKHVQEHGGGILAGGKDMLLSKVLFEPIRELWNNRNYFGKAPGGAWSAPSPEVAGGWMMLSQAA